MSVQVAPLLVLSSTTPPSQPPISKAKRCLKDSVSGPEPTCRVGDTSDCSSGRLGFSPSIWPLLSGPHQTWSVGESARRCHALMLGDVVGSPTNDQFVAFASTDSVAEAAGCSS